MIARLFSVQSAKIESRARAIAGVRVNPMLVFFANYGPNFSPGRLKDM